MGALAFTSRLNTVSSSSSPNGVTKVPLSPQNTIRWLVRRQTDFTNPDAIITSDLITAATTLPHARDSVDATSAKLSDRELESICTTAAAYPGHDPTTSINNSDNDVAALALEALEAPSPPCAGMNGRINKPADTCYVWWSNASLHLLGVPDIVDVSALRRYLLEKTQHPVLGGFGKFPGDLPDLYHSYLGLVALSLATKGDAGDLKEVDAGMCVSLEAKGRLKDVWDNWGIERALT